MVDDNIVTILWNSLGKPSFVSAGATLLSAYAIAISRKNKMRNEFIDHLMKKELVEKEEFNSLISSLKEIIEVKMDNLNQRLDDLKEFIEAKSN